MFCPAGVLCLRVDVVSGVSFGFTGWYFRSTERLCEGELYCLGHRRKVSSLCLLYKVYHRVDHPMKKYLKQFLQLVILKLWLLYVSWL